ncbi:MAG: VCBS repeat-containing protein [Thermoanaerobaculia bacterium]|nr:VCBS repeat-containing protein [Thermoanaerobaculia bacterium]
MTKRSFASVLFVATSATLIIASCASSPQKGVAPGAKVEASASAASGEESAPLDDKDMIAPWVEYRPSPPDGQWLVDMEGREYFVLPIPKKEGYYYRVDPTHVRVNAGITVELVREDDSYFYAKVYRMGDETGPVVRKEPTPEELEQIAKSYEVTTTASDDLRFVAIGDGLPRSGQWRNGFALADVDGDAALDIVHGPTRRTINGTPAIFRGDGKGGFSRWSEARFPPLAYDYGDAAVGDFNGDGKADVALAIHLRGIVALLGDGKGNYEPFSEGLDMSDPARGGWSTSPFTSRAIETIDWDRDGRMDILALSEGPSRPGATSTNYAAGKRIYLAREKGWELAPAPSDVDPVFGDEIALGDFNGDGRKDFATSISLAGNRAVFNIAGIDGSWQASSLEGIRPGAFVRSVAAADVNADGRHDLFLSYTSNEGGVVRSGIDLMLSQPGGWRRHALWSSAGRSFVTAMGAGDLDGDGRVDLVAFDDAGGPLVLRGAGGALFTMESPDGIDSAMPGCRGYSVKLADLDRDLKDEIIAGFAGERCPSGGSLRAWKAENPRRRSD